MTPSDYMIETASPADIPALLELHNANLGANGALSVAFSAEWFEQSMHEMPIVVAKRDGILVGYLVSSSRRATRHLALPEAKYRAYPAADADAYNSGPLCVSATERGQGLAPLLFQAMRERLPGREAVNFIRRDNAPSQALHRKLGFREVGAFTHDGVDYVVTAYRNT